MRNSVTAIDHHAFYGCDSLTEVYYAGSATDWDEIFIEEPNDPLFHAICYTDCVVILPGDLNSDGSVDNRDLGLLQKYLNEYDVSIRIEAADVNADGKVNNRDLGLLM